jgi:hypothetical protein
MNSSAMTIKVFGVYILVAGCCFAFIPNVLLSLLGFPPANEIWVRVLGVIAAVLGYYYLSGALASARYFFVASIYGRCAFCAGCVGLVLFADASWQLIIFGSVDLAGAVWTALALRRETPAVTNLAAQT